MPADLTAVVVPAGQLEVERVHEIVAARGRGPHLVRVAPLHAVGLVQIEIHDARRGLPSEDPDLVARLSQGGRAAFVHVNHGAQQALVHRFDDGTAAPGFAGAPDDAFAAALADATGTTLDAILAADDGTRPGIGIAASHTVALTKGRKLVVPVGTPTGFDSFAFHDRGAGHDGGGERLALFAFDARAFDEPGAELGRRLASATPAGLGPLAGARAEAEAALGALGTRSPAAAALGHQRALELAAFEAGLLFTGGEEASYWNERVLPLLALCAAPPQAVLDADEAESLDDDCEGLLEAMVETLPYAAPPGGEGTLLTQVADAEVLPLAPWAQGGEHAGAAFRLRPERLLALGRALDGNKLQAALESFARSWYRASRPGQPEGDAYVTWRRAKDEEGQADLERFVAAWAELRICLEMAAANRLEVALVFYS